MTKAIGGFVGIQAYQHIRGVDTAKGRMRASHTQGLLRARGRERVSPAGRDAAA